jgi:RteC protein
VLTGGKSKPPGETFPIRYFKTHLPRFEAELKYCELTYYALKFSPTEPLHERQDFLLRELGRRNRTIADSPDLYYYILSGRTDLDQSLFASDPDLAASYATIIAAFLALERYHAYLQEQFSELIRS